MTTLIVLKPVLFALFIKEHLLYINLKSYLKKYSSSLITDWNMIYLTFIIKLMMNKKGSEPFYIL